MNCPRCASMKVKQAVRKEGKGKAAVETNIVDETCTNCGWRGMHLRTLPKPKDDKKE